MYLETDRLILRSWQTEDFAPFAEMNADPEVMRFFPTVLDKVASNLVATHMVGRDKNGEPAFLPVIEKASGSFLGITGLNRPSYPVPLPFMPCVEVGWRFRTSAWGKGYATEAAQAWLRVGFETMKLKEIVAFTARINLRSQKVMQRLGMVTNSVDDFDHPMIAEDNILRHHVLYRLSQQRWLEGLQNV